VDVAAVDVRMPPTYATEGLVAAIEARRARPGFPVLVLSQYVEPLYARELLANGEGAVGYLLKDRVADIDGFVAAVRQVAAGGTVLDPEVVAGLVSGAGREQPLQRLTPREREVLTLMAEGRSNAAIAARLFVTEKAVGKHTNAIVTKLDLPPAVDDNRRVRAVLAWLEGSGCVTPASEVTPGSRNPHARRRAPDRSGALAVRAGQLSLKIASSRSRLV
jgi:DNA-binding NarL/FixJ family response regulator